MRYSRQRRTRQPRGCRYRRCVGEPERAVLAVRRRGVTTWIDAGCDGCEYDHRGGSTSGWPTRSWTGKTAQARLRVEASGFGRIAVLPGARPHRSLGYAYGPDPQGQVEKGSVSHPREVEMARRPSGVKSSPSSLGIVILHENMSTECGRADCPGTGSIHAAANVRACGITGCERCPPVQGGASNRRLRREGNTTTQGACGHGTDFLRERADNVHQCPNMYGTVVTQQITSA